MKRFQATAFYRKVAPAMHRLVLPLLLLLHPGELLSHEPCGCAGEAKAVGPSFRVRGRLSAWNGNPTFRIWIVGTKRMLGIRQGTEMPKELQALLGSFETEVVGDFVVCPLTRPKKGVMQIVCVGSASNLVTRTKSRLHSYKAPRT